MEICHSFSWRTSTSPRHEVAMLERVGNRKFEISCTLLTRAAPAEVANHHAQQDMILEI